MFEKEAKKWVKENTRIEHSASFGEIEVEPSAEKGFQKGAEFGYNKANEELEEKYKETICNSELNLASITEQLEELEKANEENEGKCKTAYIKGIRTMANALKDYDRTNGAWTDYFEHTVEEVLNKLLKDQ